MAIGMTLIGVGIIWATQAPVHGQFRDNLAGPFLVAGAGTAFAFIPISVAALAGVESDRGRPCVRAVEHRQQIGGAIGVAIASSVATSHTASLLHAGQTLPVALTGGYQRAFGVLGAIALLALPAIFTVVRREPTSDGNPILIDEAEPVPAVASTR